MNAEPLVDAHVHIWDPRALTYPWLTGEPRLDRPVLPAGIDRSAHASAMVFIQAGAAPQQALAEVEWVLGQPWPELVGIVADLRLDTSERGALLESYARIPQVVGVRHILQHAARDRLDSAQNADGLVRVGEAGLVFDATVSAGQLGDLAALHARAADTALVLDHLGNPPVASGIGSSAARSWLDGVRRVAGQPTAAVKLSGVRWNDRSRPFFEAALAAFGVERSMLGSDFPVTDPGERRWDEVADILAPTAENREALRWRTASQIYGLVPPSERTYP